MEEDEKQTKECLFSFGRINKYFIIPFLCPIFFFIFIIFFNLLVGEENDGTNHYFFTNMLSCFSLLIGGLLYFVVYIRTKTEETRNNATINIEPLPNRITYIYKYNPHELKKENCKIIGYLVIMSMINSFYFYQMFPNLVEIFISY